MHILHLRIVSITRHTFIGGGCCLTWELYQSHDIPSLEVVVVWMVVSPLVCSVGQVMVEYLVLECLMSVEYLVLVGLLCSILYSASQKIWKYITNVTIYTWSITIILFYYCFLLRTELFYYSACAAILLLKFVLTFRTDILICRSYFYENVFLLYFQWLTCFLLHKWCMTILCVYPKTSWMCNLNNTYFQRETSFLQL